MGNTSMNSFGQQQQMQQAPSTTGKIARSIEKLQQAYAPYQDVAGKSSASAAAGRYNDECMFKTYMYDRRSGSAQGADPSLTGTLLEQVIMHSTMNLLNFLHYLSTLLLSPARFPRRS